MSDTSEDTSSTKSQTEKEDSVCRDFSRGVCERKFCKYRHENEVRALNFCHDFQNNFCPRNNCKFIHCTTEEVEMYKKTGEMSNQIIAEATRKNQIYTGVPTCTRFKRGQCRRAYCKYRHITIEEEEAEIMEMIRNNNQRKQLILNNTVTESHMISSVQRNVSDIRVNGVSLNDIDDCGPPLPKRRFLTQEQDLEIGDLYTPPPNFKGYFAGNPPPPILSRVGARTLILEEENSLLRNEIEQLKRQVSDLTATNEFLLDQNATLRVTSKRNGGVGAVSMPSVTITNSNAPQQVIRTVTASVATVPVSLATVSTCNPVSGNPTISIAGMPAVSIAQPTHLLAPSQQILVTTNPTTQLAIANSTPAQLAIAQQNLATNLAAQQAQPQLTSQAQQLALATTTQQLTSQAQHMANQQLALATAPQPQTLTLTSAPQLSQQLTSQAQQLAANQALTSQAQQLTLAGTTQQLNQQLANQQLTSQAQQLANQQLANQQLTSQAQQLANQQLTSQAQQLANQQLTSQAQQLANQQLTSQAQQLANQQLTSQAQQLANQQLTSQAQQLANQQLTSQAQQLANQQLTSQAQQLNQQLTSQAQQLANQQLTSQAQQLATQQLTSQAQQLALANTQQLTSQAQQLALANSAQQLTVASVPHSWL